MSLKDREKQILISTIDSFIENANPVSSGSLIKDYNITWSSATIRAVMAKLEENGYLKKAHNQSGRIPTTKGYKIYTNELELTKTDNADKKLITQLDSLFQKRLSTVDNVIEESVKIISEMTNLVTVAKSDNKNSVLEAITLFVIDDIKSVITVVVNGDDTLSKVIKNPDGVTADDVRISIEIMNDRLKGTELKDLPEHLQAIKPLISDKVKNAEKLFEMFMSMIFEGITQEKNYTSGTSNIVKYKDNYDNLDKQVLLDVIEDHSIWKILEETEANDKKTYESNDTSVSFTEESTSGLRDIVIINKDIEINENIVSFALAAPRRVSYKKVSTIFNWLEDKLKEINKGDKNG